MVASVLHLDVTLFTLINGLAGNWLLDRLVAFVEGNHLVRTLPLFAPLWFFWYQEHRDRTYRRNLILTIIVGAVVALAINRALSLSLPFRVRPMYAVGLDFHHMSLPATINLVEWSSFPSDNATFAFAVATGVFLLWRPLGAYLMLHALVFVCLPRIYQGIHYPSDIAAGALIGVVAMLPVRRIAALPLWDIIRRMAEAWPGWFAMLFSLTIFEMSVTYDDLRGIAGAFVDLHKVDPHAADIAFICCVLAMGIVAWTVGPKVLSFFRGQRFRVR